MGFAAEHGCCSARVPAKTSQRGTFMNRPSLVQAAARRGLRLFALLVALWAGAAASPRDAAAQPAGNKPADAAAPAPAQSPRQARKKQEAPYSTLHRARVTVLIDQAQKLKALCEAGVHESTRTKPPPAPDNAQPAAKLAAEQLLKDFEKYAVQLAAYKAAFPAFEQSVCKRFCGYTPRSGSPPQPGLDFCALRDPVAANAAAVADWSSAAHLIDYVKEQQDKLGDPDREVSNLRQGGLEFDLATGFTPAGIAGAITGAAAESLQVSLAALAKLIEDRAKREGLGWFLQKVGEDLCGLGDEPDKATAETKLVQREIRAYWFPALCSLAGKSSDLMMQYGGGGKLLEGIRGALASDVKGWPGAAAGLGLSSVFWAGLTTKPAENLFQCPIDGKADECKSVELLRKAASVFVGQIFAGDSATSALLGLGSRIDTANRKVTTTDASLQVEGLQVAACAASVPFYFDTYGDSLPTMHTSNAFAPGSPDLDRSQKSEALLIAALASAPACWSIVGKGLDKDRCAAVGGKGTGDECDHGKVYGALKEPKRSLERLGVAIRLAGAYAGGAQAMTAQWAKLVQALEAYEQAAQAVSDALKKDPVGPSPADLGKVTDAKTLPDVLRAMESLMETQARLAQSGPFGKLLQAALGLAQAGLDMGSTTLGAVEGALDAGLYPGLPKMGADMTTFAAELKKARATLDALSKDLATLSGVLSQDWGTTLSAAVASVNLHIEVICAGKGKNPCPDVIPRLSKHMSLVVTLMTEKDPDRLAEALDSVADPPGGWRTKSKPGTFVVSLASFPGFAGGGELRTGQYGVFREDFKRAYGVTPALVMPVGVDLAWGHASCFSPTGLFISLIDPAAFLQYDVSKDGRLPGPRLTTVLSPGLWARFAIPSTPFSLNPFVVWRPGLRAWDASINGPSADALQFGLAATVDVTLFQLYTRHPEASE
jgi:hypothetical protein